MRIAYVHGYEGVTGPLLLGAFLDAVLRSRVWNRSGGIYTSLQRSCHARVCLVQMQWQRT